MTRTPNVSTTPVHALVEALRQQIQRLEGSRRQAESKPIVFKYKDLEHIVPHGGFRPGTLVEWLSAGDGGGAETLAMRLAREACCQGGALVVLDGRRVFYPPAAARAGIDLQRIVLVRPQDAADHDWALDQALRCTAVDAVWAWAERIDPHAFRRLQLAAEQGGTLGLLMRSVRARHEPSWAEMRLLVEPLPSAGPAARRRVRVHLLRCRGATDGHCLDLELDDETHTVHPLAWANNDQWRNRA